MRHIKEDDHGPTIPDGLIQDFTPFNAGWDFLIRLTMERLRREHEEKTALEGAT